MDVIWDMETGDPDDVVSLLLILGHRELKLRAVTICPGGQDQVGFVQYLLKRVLGDREAAKIPIGGFTDWTNTTQTKQYLSAGLVKLFGAECREHAMPDGLGWQVIADTLAKYPRATLITGAPLKNLNQLLIQQPDIAIERCVIQGGFAGDAVVPPAKRMKKFDGMNECDTWNFGGCHEGAERMLNAPGIKLRQLCSKNVCHQVVYTAAMHERLEPIKNKNAAYSLLYEMMDKYLTNKGEKKLHDPLAVCTAIDPTIIEFAEVECYRTKTKWGSRLCAGTNTWISVSANMRHFESVFLDED